MSNLKLTKTLYSSSPEETARIAGELFVEFFQNNLNSTLIFALAGDLGAGKTEFSRGIGAILNLKNINSPTFVLEHEYNVNFQKEDFKFLHIDLWRMEEKSELENLSIEKFLGQKNLIIIEWADRFSDQIIQLGKRSGKFIYITIEYGEDSDRRIIKLFEF